MAEAFTLPQAVELFAKVKKSLEVNKSLQWTLGLDAMRAMIEHVSTEETQRFIDEFLLQVLQLMTSQSPNKLGPYERDVINESIDSALKVMMQVLPEKPHHIIILSRVFDASITYYNGLKAGYQYYHGFPSERIRAAKLFVDLNGFTMLAGLFKMPTFDWPGCDVMLNILRTLNIADVYNAVEEDIKIDIVHTMMKKIQALTDDQLKRENSDVLSQFIHVLGSISQNISTRHVPAAGEGINMDAVECSNNFHKFWLENTFKVMNSGSIVLKLFAWEQLGDIINDARATRPLAKTIIVSDAGTEFVNGVFTITPRNSDTDVVQYTKPTNEPKFPLLTLFRCTMRTKAKWWFISQADLEKPGTDKDIDFYLHKSTPEDEREPPSRNWTRVNPGISLIGAEPAPTLKRGELLIPNGKKRSDYLDDQLIRFCAEKEILKSIFGPSMHREIVARGGKLLSMLAEYDALKSEDLQTIWKAAMTSQEVDVVEEIFALLVPLSTFLSDELFFSLIDMPLDALKSKSDDNYSRVAQFTEKFAMDNFRHISGGALSEKALSKLLSLVWEIYKNAAFDNLKNKNALQLLLSHCFGQKGGIDMVTQRVEECMKALEDCCDKVADGRVNEEMVSRVILTLYFLISKHTSTQMIAKLKGDKGLPACIIREIERFVKTNRSLLETKKMKKSAFSSALRDRLQVLRCFYGIDINTTISLESVQALSELLSSNPVEMDEFFLFLKSSGSNSQEAMVSNEDALSIFKTIICSESIDWSRCGDGAFECFSAFFTELENMAKLFPVDTELPPKLGLETLWRIALNIGSETATTNAIHLLLDAYEALSFREDEAYVNMLQLVFSHLHDASSERNESSMSTEQQEKVKRCISILTSAMAKSPGNNSLAHAVRGTMSRISISVFYRRVTSYYNPSTQSDVMRAEKGSEGVIRVEVHPLHTLRQLKEMINSTAGLGANISSIVIDHHQNNPFAQGANDRSSFSPVNELTRVADLGLVDDGELSVSYQIPYGQHKSYPEDDRFDAQDDSAATNIGQLLANDYALFDCLLSLCERSTDEELTKSIWTLLMVLPTQPDLIQQSLEQICFPEGSTSSPLTPGLSKSNWNQILQNATPTRKTYMLQIVDNMLQPAPEINDRNSYSKSLEFKEAFLASGGFQMVLKNLIDSKTSEGIVASTGLAVCLHIIHFLLFGSQKSLDAQDGVVATSLANIDDSIVSVANMEQVVPVSAPAVAVHDTSSVGVMDIRDEAHERLSEELLQKMEPHSAQLIEKLLNLARNAAANQESGVVQNALMVIAKLIKNPGAASQLTSNTHSETLLRTVLRSASKKVREMAAEFAVQVGRNQPIVFDWLLHELKQLNPDDENCTEIFSALSSLMFDLQSAAYITGTESPADFDGLAQILSDKLISYPRVKTSLPEERHVLLGYLQTLENLLSINPKSVQQTTLGSRLVVSFLDEFLFRMPDVSEDVNDSSAGPICDTTQTRQAAFNVLSAYINISPEGFERVLTELSSLSKLAAKHMHYFWGLQVSHDIKKADIKFSGLKNQGCTCYMNSLLQVLFMNTAFREAILRTPLLEVHRTTLWHRSEEDIVGEQILFEWHDGNWRQAQIIGFDAATSRHRVQYQKSDGSIDEVASFVLHDGRFQRETGRVKVVPPNLPPDFELEPVSESEEAAYRVLDNLQRAFCFMKYSKRRFFDPRPLVDACKTLNLNFSVYHQNDAAEFCDQLLDRIETATKGKHTKKDMWNNVFQKHIFGGKFLYQKIPQDCDNFNEDKDSCGHWQSSRTESYLKIELMIRGKEKIEESLDELMQGELMDGDNKIHCDVCTQKKATVRRTCLGALPPVLIMHLKRFDLDFQTFETVKLNNRMEFPMKINMLRYTKEGIEAEERKQRREAAATAAANDEENELDKSSPALQYELDEEATEIDPGDYEYELQGVLVHAGIAQGGHYYSFIKSPDSEDRWFKFDDDEVTPFNPENIPIQCFGGPFSAHGLGSHSHHSEEDRSSNALMLLYSKVKPPVLSPTSAAAAGAAASVGAAAAVEGAPSSSEQGSSSSSSSESTPLKMIDGVEAYLREVRESNFQHILSCYLLDPDSHAFVRGMVNAVTKYQQDQEKNAAKASSSSSTMLDVSDSMNMSDIRDALDGNSYSSSLVNRLQWCPTDVPDDLPLRTVQFGCSFLLDVVLHCRERAATRSSVNMLKNAFEAYPHTASWFVAHVLDANACSWMQDFLLSGSDALARGTFVQILVQAVAVIAPKDTYALEKFKQSRFPEIREAAAQQDPAGLIAFLIRQMLDLMFRAVNHVRTSDELFVLIRDLAAIPCICYSMQGLGIISFLSYFVMPELVPPMSRSMFERHLSPHRTNIRLEYGNLLQSVFEAMAAVLGVPQLRKVSLLQERNYWETDLVPDAKEALTTIFFESSHNGGMDHNDINRYFDRVTGDTGHKVTPSQVRSILDRFTTNADGRLGLEGFLQYHADNASFNPKNVWRDLHAFGYRNDLTRTKPSGPAGAPATGGSSGAGGAVDADSIPPDTEVLNITENCRMCLTCIMLYECGLTASEAAARAIARRVCLNDEGLSAILIQQALHKLLAITTESHPTWNQHPLIVINDFIRLILGIDDGLQLARLRHVLLASKVGLAVVAAAERRTPSSDFNSKLMYDKYIGFVQELTTVPGVVANLTTLAQEDAKVKFVRGHLRLNPNNALTENENYLVRNTVVVVEKAGAKEVNGEYHFTNVKFNAGYYSRRGTYNGNKNALFTLYKCSMKQGGYQWFLSVTPEGAEPGSNDDIDFYYSQPTHTTATEKLPPAVWARLNTSISKDPPPQVTCVRLNAATAGSGSGSGSGGTSATTAAPADGTATVTVRPGRPVGTGGSAGAAPVAGGTAPSSAATSSTAVPESSDSEDDYNDFPSSYVPGQYE